MKRSFLLQTACLTMVIVWGGQVRGEDAPIQREDIGRALEMYRWLVNHEEFSAAGKLAAELQAIHPDDSQVQLIVENAQLRAAVREANRVLVDDEAVSAVEMAPANQWEMLPPWETFGRSAQDPFQPDINWRKLGNIRGSAPVMAPEIVQTAGEEPQDAPPRLFDSVTDWGDLHRLRTPAEDEQELSAEARIWTALSSPVSMQFHDAPLSAIVEYITETCNVNIVIDVNGLQEEGVTPETVVTLAVEGMPAKRALNLLLRPLNLDYMIEDEVIKITSHTRRLGDLTARVYAVADLVTPIPHRTPGSGQDRLERSADAGFDALIDLITTTVHPDTWSHAGGEGIVTTHEGTLSLVVRQTQSAHDEIGDLLIRLRSLRDVQVSHALHLLSVPVSELAELGLSDGQTVRVLAADERSDYETKFVGEHAQFDVQALPGITLFNRQTGTVVDSERTTLISSVASADRRSARVNVAIPETLEPGDVLSAVHSAEVPDGGVALILVSDAEHLLNAENRAEVLAVTPRIQVREEEEELLGLPVP